MRALRPMTREERDFAEQHHDLVIEFLHYRRLPMDEFYDVVIFGYLSAVQQYIRNPPAGVTFKAMAFWAMKDAILREDEYRSRAKRCGVTVGLDDAGSTLTDPRQDTERRVEGKALLEQVMNVATPREARIINRLIDGPCSPRGCTAPEDAKGCRCELHGGLLLPGQSCHRLKSRLGSVFIGSSQLLFYGGGL